MVGYAGRATQIEKWELPYMGYQWIEDDDDDDGDDGQKQGKPADLPEPARRHMRKVEKENADLKKQIADLSAAQRKANVSDVLKAKGYDPIIATFIPSTVDTSEEAVGKWLDEHGAVFAKAKTTEDTNDSGTDDVDTVPADIAQALGMVTNISGTAQAPERIKDLMAQLNDPNLTPEKLDALIIANGRRS